MYQAVIKASIGSVLIAPLACLFSAHPPLNAAVSTLSPGVFPSGPWYPSSASSVLTPLCARGAGPQLPRLPEGWTLGQTRVQGGALQPCQPETA